MQKIPKNKGDKMEVFEREGLEREGAKELYFVKPNLRNVYRFTVPCSCIIELLNSKRSCV
jgi:hypothetical protein